MSNIMARPDALSIAFEKRVGVRHDQDLLIARAGRTPQTLPVLRPSRSSVSSFKWNATSRPESS
jgi:hypothetical protein